jgi:YfiH family protein
MSTAPLELILPNWPAPSWVLAGSTTRVGGVSNGVFASLNLGDHVGDAANLVAENRALLQKRAKLPSAPAWLQQVHGTHILPLSEWTGDVVVADASLSRAPAEVCVVMTADCLPVLFCCPDTRQVAAAHAGWRGLCDGILEKTLAQFSNPSSVLVWLGPCIGATAFEVGDEVRQQFLATAPVAQIAFTPSPNQGKWLADLRLLASQRLESAGAQSIYATEHCTLSDADQFFSYRRDGQTGRMATFICMLAEEPA